MIFNNSPLKKKKHCSALILHNCLQMEKSNFLGNKTFIKIYSIQYTTLSMIIYFQICTKGKPLRYRTKGLVFFQTRAGHFSTFD